MKQYVIYDRTHKAFIKQVTINNTEISLDHTRSYDEALCFLEYEAQKLVNLVNAIKVLTGTDLTVWSVPWDSEVKSESVVKDETHRPSVADKR